MPFFVSDVKPRRPDNEVRALATLHGVYVFSWPLARQLYHVESLYLPGDPVSAAALSATIKWTLYRGYFRGAFTMERQRQIPWMADMTDFSTPPRPTHDFFNSLRPAQNVCCPLSYPRDYHQQSADQSDCAKYSSFWVVTPCRLAKLSTIRRKVVNPQ
jgi:hypothetical protein